MAVDICEIGLYPGKEYLGEPGRGKV